MKTNIANFFVKKKGIIFDCDGVIIDSRDANVKFYNLILQRLNLPPMPKEAEEYVHSHTVFESIRYIVPDKLYEKALEEGKKISYREVIPFIRLEDGIRDVLTLLKKKGKKCAINTNRTNTMPLILEVFSLQDFFSPVVTAEMVSRPKPHPESIFYILKTWNIPPGDVVFIGDSQVDQITARAAHIDFISYKNNQLEAVFNLTTYQELKNILFLK